MAEKYHHIMVEKIAELDDELATDFLEGKEISVERLKAALRAATIKQRCFPVLCGAALRNVGVQILIDSIVQYLPAPTEKPDVTGTDPNDKDIPLSRPHDPDAPFAGLVFKVVSDMHGDLTYIRVYSGKLGKGTRILNPGNGKTENASRIFEMHAQNRIPLDEVTAGNIVAIVGIKNSYTGDTLCDSDKPIILERMHFPEPVIAMSIEPKSQDDKRKLSEALGVIRREDPSFRSQFDEETGQTIIMGMGELHLEIIRNKLIRDMKINVETGKPKVSYREAISKKVEDVRGLHKKQSGGQFGDCMITLEPYSAAQAEEAELDFTDNFAFENKIVGGVIPKEFIPSIEYGIRQQAKTGVKFGYPLINAKATLTYGSYHDVDSSQIAFELAGMEALKLAVDRAGPQLLEPIMKVVITVPNDYLGNVTGDVSSRRGMIIDTEDRDPVKMVQAEIPLSELFGYTTALRGMSQGRASATMEFLEYRPMPAGLMKEMTEEKGGAKKK
jgi:elongation factor G